jgi:microcystin-dependent protein
MDPFVGEIRIFGGTFAPMDWAFCDGQTMPIAQYDVLYALVGTTYGGDGANNFNLPDLRGRLPVHMGTRDGVNYIIGQAGGQETVALQANQVAAHTHKLRAKKETGNQNNPAGMVWAGAPERYSASTPALAMRSSAVQTAGGGGQAHDNVMPFFVVNFIISLSGYFPQRP